MIYRTLMVVFEIKDMIIEKDKFDINGFIDEILGFFKKCL